MLYFNLSLSVSVSVSVSDSQLSCLSMRAPSRKLVTTRHHTLTTPTASAIQIARIHVLSRPPSESRSFYRTLPVAHTLNFLCCSRYWYTRP